MESLRNSIVFRAEENVLGADSYLSEECTICFEAFTNKAFVSDCLHHFCYECIISWAKIKPVCPLCIQPINGIINNVRSLDDYDIQSVLPSTADVFDDAGSEWEFSPDYTDPETSYGEEESMSIASEFESSYVQQDELSDPFAEAIGEAYENPEGGGLFFPTDDDDHSEGLSVHSYSDNESSSYDEEEDKDDNSENESEENYEENDNEEDEYDNNNNDEDYEADDDDYNEDDYYDFDCQPESDYVDDEWDYASSNLSNGYPSINLSTNLLSLSNILSPAHLCEESTNVWDDYYEPESAKDYDEEEEEYGASTVKYDYIDNSESDQDYLSNDDTAEYIYSSGYY